MMSLDVDTLNTIRLPIEGIQRAAAIDYDVADQLVYWTDVEAEVIRRARLDGTGVEDLISRQVGSPDGIAVEWIGRNLYWTNGETERIEVSRLDGVSRKVLIYEDLDRPRAIVVDPSEGYMYWTDWGESPRIERAELDGSNRLVLFKESIYWPNGLAIDYTARKIYWGDAKLQKIEYANLDGTGRRVLLDEGLQHIFGLTLLGDYVYWTDWKNDGNVQRVHKTTGENRQVIVDQLPGLMGLKAVTMEKTEGEASPCQPDNGGCSHLCLLSPDPPNYKCACPNGIKLLEDGKTCTDGATEMLIVARKKDLRMISLDTPDHTDVALRIDDVKHAIAIDYDVVDGFVYWTDDENKAIRRAKLDGTDGEYLITTEVDRPDGIAVDWVARNLYWTDTGTKRIEVARLNNGTSRKILIDQNLGEPRTIVLDPSEGYMYWTDWGQHPRVERAELDGSGRAVLVNTSLGWPNGLAIDYTARKLYWGDAKTDKIEYANLDGTGRRVLLDEDLPHLFGFSLLGDYIYWTDWQKRSVERVHKTTGENRQNIVDQLVDLMGLKAVNVQRTEGWNPCVENNGGCSHLCLYRPTGVSCGCPTGMELLNPDGRTCVVPEAFLLILRSNDIRRVSIEPQNHEDLVLPIRDMNVASAFDFHDNRIYWADVNLDTISRAFMNGSGAEKIIQSGLDKPQSLAVDWVAHNLFWTDTGTRRIEVARLDGSSRKVLIWRDLESPWSLALDPAFGSMYWSDWSSESKIERASMDGSNRVVLVDRVGRANGLTIDYQERRLCWADMEKALIESSNMQGDDRRRVISDNIVFTLTLYQDYVYWTDVVAPGIKRANKETGENRTLIHGTNYDRVGIKDILVLHHSRQSGSNKCAVDNGGCPHLCLATAMSASTSAEAPVDLPVRCGCPSHWTLDPDKKTCHPPDSFLLFSQRKNIRRMVLDEQQSPDIVLPLRQLRDVKAIDYDRVGKHVYWIEGRIKQLRRAAGNGTDAVSVVSNRDGLFNPYDMAIDEYSRHIYWTCSQTNTINVTRISDLTPVGAVISGGQPRAIVVDPTRGYMFWTNMGNTPTIERAALDGTERRTLFNNNDIKRPGSLAVDITHGKLYWTDYGLNRIQSSDLDGTNRRVLVDLTIGSIVTMTIYDDHLYWSDSVDKIIERIDKLTGGGRTRIQSGLSQVSDLVGVESMDTSQMKRHPCATDNGGCSHICIATGDSGRRCSCPVHLVLLPDKKTCGEPRTCGPNEFTCRTGEVVCIPLSWKCDGLSECSDRSDEADCTRCRDDQYTCDNGDCVDAKNVCDGNVDCMDGSDERHRCHSTMECTDDQFTCDNGHCVDAEKVCNGEADCTDQSDERQCHESLSEFLDTLLRNYDRRLRPDMGQTTVNIGLIRRRVIGLDTSSGLLTLHTWINMEWRDQRLAVRASQPKRLLELSAQDIWMPDVYLISGVKADEMPLPLTTEASIFSDGTVRYVVPWTFTVPCKVRSKSGWDCRVVFQSWNKPADEIALSPLDHSLAAEEYNGDLMWTVQSVSADSLITNVRDDMEKSRLVFTLVVAYMPSSPPQT
ncbi:low-density lipoprotein receptor-related protein 6-like isoform X1 [Branchiostoma lanceolatum]|uniref:low-density lipoprotein receptor-related protein 6-like isoform X1 n=1 Tax=Branchiostoma lanceolatum TaxID=7740 RepID=UPI003453912E